MPFFDGLSGCAVSANIHAQKAGLQQTCRCQTATDFGIHLWTGAQACSTLHDKKNFGY
jgi:hypothetical protein